MLTAQFAFSFEPGGKHAFIQHVKDGETQGDVLMTFRFVVAVDALKGLVQLVDEDLEVVGFFFKFHQPFVRTVAFVAKIYRGRRIVVDDGACFLAGDGDGLVRIVDDDLFAKGVDKVFEPSAYLDTKGVAGRELDGVPSR